MSRSNLELHHTQASTNAPFFTFVAQWRCLQVLNKLRRYSQSLPSCVVGNECARASLSVQLTVRLECTTLTNPLQSASQSLSRPFEPTSKYLPPPLRSTHNTFPQPSLDSLTRDLRKHTPQIHPQKLFLTRNNWSQIHKPVTQLSCHKHLCLVNFILAKPKLKIPVR